MQQVVVPTTPRYTFADLLTIPDAETLYEVFGGQLVVFSAPDTNHAEVVGDLWDFLRRAQRAGLGRAYTAPRAVAFDYSLRGERAEDVTHPDLCFISAERRAIIGRRCIEAAPDLVIEVLSPTTRSDDEPGGRKWVIYEQYSVLHYWTVDPEARLVRQYLWNDGRYRETHSSHQSDMLTSPLFPTFTLAVAQIFLNVF